MTVEYERQVFNDNVWWTVGRGFTQEKAESNAERNLHPDYIGKEMRTLKITTERKVEVVNCGSGKQI